MLLFKHGQRENDNCAWHGNISKHKMQLLDNTNVK